MNVLSIAAAYGVLTAIFQFGWLHSLIGLDSAVEIVSYVPLFMFAVLFGLSMDYEVFLVSQIEEHVHAGENNTQSVVSGLVTSARVITAAATIMVFVFGSFVVNGDPTVKQFGIGLAVAVILDATIVRCLLVPALMVMMGKVNWYIPGWLERLLPRISIEGAEFFRSREPRPPAEPRSRARAAGRRGVLLNMDRKPGLTHTPAEQRRRGPSGIDKSHGELCRGRGYAADHFRHDPSRHIGHLLPEASRRSGPLDQTPCEMRPNQTPTRGHSRRQESAFLPARVAGKLSTVSGYARCQRSVRSRGSCRRLYSAETTPSCLICERTSTTPMFPRRDPPRSGI